MRSRIVLMSSILLCGLWSVFVGVLQAASPCQAEPEASPYKIVWEESSESPPTFLRLRVSVDRWLAVEDVKALVCRIASEQDLTLYRLVQINFYFQVDDYAAMAQEPESGLGRRRMAFYSWNRVMSFDKYNLGMLADEQGNQGRLQLFGFDHNRDCPLRAGRGPKWEKIP